MDFVYGLLTAVVFFLMVISGFYLGIRFERQKKPPDKTTDEETARKQDQLKKDFLQLMNYDVDKATARKKLT